MGKSTISIASTAAEKPPLTGELDDLRIEISVDM
jgi:hypothetical protein